MTKKYSKLSIDKSKIQDWIQLWCEENLENECTISCNEISGRLQYKIISGSSTIKLDFIKCSGGLLTIAPNVGANIPTSTQIAESIFQRVKNNIKDSPFAHGFSIIVSDDDFKTIIELLSGMEGVSLSNYSEQLNDGQAKYKLYRYVGPAKDCVTIKYFVSTKRMQLQGKPLWLFNEIVAMVSDEETRANDVVDAHLKYCNLDIPRIDIYEEMESVLGADLFSFLSNTQKALLATTFILDKIEVDMPDYSGLITPALRAYEGFTKKLFVQKGLPCDGNMQLGEFFERPDKMVPFSMKSKYSECLTKEVESQFISMYNFYYQQRHPYAHASAYDFDTTIISNRKSAEELFHEIILKMKAHYRILK